MSKPATGVYSIRSLSGYIGGKYYLRKTLCPMIDAIDHRAYVEPFVGMGNIFLGRQNRPKVEVINDINGEVATLFRVVQRHPEALCQTVRFQTANRADYDRLYATPESSLTDIERAARFLTLRRMTYAGKSPYPNGFSVSATTNKTFDAPEIIQRIERLHDRLARVVIEELDFSECIQRYDKVKTLFYLDPPYWGCSHLYRESGFKQARFQDLADILRRTKGMWIMSLNDTPDVRDLFGFAAMRLVTTRYSAKVGHNPFQKDELLLASNPSLVDA